jgi:uncharacterized protein
MPLAEDRPEGLYAIRAVSARAVHIDDAEFNASLLVMPDRIQGDLPLRRVDQLDESWVERVAQWTPEVVILGSGTRQVFPPPSVLAAFLRRGIGLESMDNAAAARTYNLLALEGRRVAALLLIDID